MSLPARVAIQIWAFLFVAFLGTEPVLSIPEARWIGIVGYAAPVVAVGIARLTRAVDRLDAVVLGVTAVYAVICLLSPDRTASLETLGMACAFAALFIAARQASPDVRQRLAVAAASGFAFTLVVHAVLWVREKAAWIAAGGGVPRLESFDVFVWSSANAIPVVALVGIGLVCWMPPGPVRVLVAVVMAVAAAITVPLSVGRAGWLGLGVAAVVALAILAPGRQRRPILIGLGLAASAGALALVALAFVGRETLFRLLQGRDLVWSQAINLVGESPLVGIGPGTYAWARLAIDAPYADRLSVRLAHNVPLQTAVDGGLLLLLSAGTLVAVWALHVRHRGEWGVTAKVSVAVLCGYAATSLFDDQSHLPAITACVVALAAWLVGPAERTASRARFVAPLVLGGLALLALPAVIATTSARTVARDARDAAVAGAWADAAAGFADAAQRNPSNPGYRLGLGLSHANLGDTAAAIDAYLEVLRLSPGDPRAYGALALLEPDRADDWLRQAAERTVTDPQYLVRHADELLTRGEQSVGLDAYARAVAREPRLYDIARQTLSDGTGLRQAVLGVLDRSVITATTPDAVRWDMALADGDVPDDAGSAWLAVQAALEGDSTESRALLEMALAEKPHDPHTYQAMLAARRLACVDLDGLPDPDRLLALLVPAPDDDTAVRVAWDQTYREPGLGDYQPVPWSGSPGTWPWPLVGDAVACSP